MFRFLFKNKVHPINESEKSSLKKQDSKDINSSKIDETPPVKKQNYMQLNTLPESSFSKWHSSYEETFYMIIPDENISCHGDQLSRFASEGVPGENLFVKVKTAIEFAKKNSGSFTIHEFTILIAKLNIEENKNHVEVYKFDAAEYWRSAKIFSPKDLNGKDVDPEKITFTAYVILPGATPQILNSSHKKTESFFPKTYPTAQAAFYEAKKQFPHHALTLMELKIPFVDIDLLKARVKNVLPYLIENSTSIISFSQFNKRFEEGNKISIEPKQNIATDSQKKRR